MRPMSSPSDRPETVAAATTRPRGWGFRLASLLVGALLGLFAASIDHLAIVAFTFVAALWLMTSAIPGKHARDFRRVANGFFMLALFASWAVYLSIRGLFSG
jgi:hypothetical protein